MQQRHASGYTNVAVPKDSSVHDELETLNNVFEDDFESVECEYSITDGHTVRCSDLVKFVAKVV